MGKINVEVFDNFAIISPSGHFTGGEETDELVEVIDKNGIAANSNLIINLKDVQYLSSIVIGIIVRMHVKFSETSYKIIFCNLNKTLMDVLNMTKVSSYLMIADDIESAKSKFNKA
jgi:anti-anti-sigma factor